MKPQGPTPVTHLHQEVPPPKVSTTLQNSTTAGEQVSKHTSLQGPFYIPTMAWPEP